MIELNKIYNQDCLEGMKLIDDNSIDLIVTDPPYLVTSRGNSGNSGGMFRKQINKNGKVFEHNSIDIIEWLNPLYRVLKESGHCYIMTNNKNLMHYLDIIGKSDFHFIKSLIWDKGNKIMGQFYMSQFEYILFLRKGFGKKINNCGTPDIIKAQNIKTKENGGGNMHDTEKPEKLMNILIENSSKQSDTVLDPFMGSGTTAISCIKNSRKFLGFEIDKKLFEVSDFRIKKELNQIKLF